jgi:cyclin-dependent kinase 7
MLDEIRDRKALYTKDRKIGEGTYAIVYIGHYTPEGQSEPIKIAIKKIKLGAYKDGLDLSAIREVTTLQELHQHPNVIHVLLL